MLTITSQKILKVFNPILKSLFFILFFNLTIHTAFAFDENSLPSGQYNNGMKTGNNLAVTAKPKVLQGVSVEEKLGKTIDPNLTYVNQDGQTKKFSEILGGKPILLTLNYYRCSTLCSVQLVNLAKTMAKLGWFVGKDFNMATISFDPTDNPEGSLKAKNNYVTLLNQPNANWNFYTGTQDNITKLTSELGYFYKYDPLSKEYAHAAAIFVISPKGVISRYLYGVTFPYNQVKFALMDASENKIGTTTDQVLLTCFHYNPTSGKYDLFAMNFLKVGAFLTVLCILAFLVYFIRRDRRRFVKL